MPPAVRLLALSLVLAASLCGQALEPDADPHWKILAGLEPAPALPAAMLAVGQRVFLVHDATVSEYSPESGTWKRDIATLPATVGSGVAVEADKDGALLILRGAKSREWWRVDVKSGAVTALPPLPRPVGRGASLSIDPVRGAVYAIRGDQSLDFLRFDPAAATWSVLERVGGTTTLAAIGQSTGAIQYWKDALYVWPDHHIQRYDITTNQWLDHVHMSYGQRPWWDGGMWAHDGSTSHWIVLQGGHSRTLSFFDPEKHGFAFLRPRLPLMLSGEGSRAVIVDVKGERTLLVYAIAEGNRMLAIPLKDLEPVRPEAPAADTGSAWATMHESSGSSLVRRNAPKPVLGLLGKCGTKWYFGRLKNLRLLDPVENTWSQYPGVDIGKAWGLGLCAAADPKGQLLVLAGAGKHAAMITTKEGLASRTLSETPENIGLGAALVWHEGRFIALAGGESRSVLGFDPVKEEWSRGTELPESAPAPGSIGAGLGVSRLGIVAVAGERVLLLDSKTNAWREVAKLPFALSTDGGMLAAAPELTRCVAVAGGGSRRLVAFDLAEPETMHEHLLPDAVSVPGPRALLDQRKGAHCFAIHRGHDTHEIWVRLLDELFAKPAKGER